MQQCLLRSSTEDMIEDHYIEAGGGMTALGVFNAVHSKY